MTEQMTDQLVLHDVSVRYGDVVAVDAATASAAPGEITAVTGHSGAGKTSLLWAVGGMLDDGRSDGSISLGDKPIGDEATSRSAGAVLIPQGSALAEVLTARDNIAIPLVAAGMSGGEASALADRTLASVGLAEHGGHLAEELSGGQRQRVAVARGLALSSLRLESGSAVLLADEPTSELAHDTRELVVGLLQDIARRGGIVLLATHDPEVAEVAAATWHLEDGRLTATARP